MAALEKLADREKLLSLGTIQMEKQLKLFKRGIGSAVTSFSFLHKNVPDPFKDEWNGGPGQVIHHKFIYVTLTISHLSCFAALPICQLVESNPTEIT